MNVNRKIESRKNCFFTFPRSGRAAFKLFAGSDLFQGEAKTFATDQTRILTDRKSCTEIILKSTIDHGEEGPRPLDSKARIRVDPCPSVADILLGLSTQRMRRRTVGRSRIREKKNEGLA
jgi:hypothetical protein